MQDTYRHVLYGEQGLQKKTRVVAHTRGARTRGGTRARSFGDVYVCILQLLAFLGQCRNMDIQVFIYPLIRASIYHSYISPSIYPRIRAAIYHSYISPSIYQVSINRLFMLPSIHQLFHLVSQLVVLAAPTCTHRRRVHQR